MGNVGNAQASPHLTGKRSLRITAMVREREMVTQRTKDVERMTVELPIALSERVRKFRHQKMIESKVAAIRRLIERGLDAEAQDDGTAKVDRKG